MHTEPKNYIFVDARVLANCHEHLKYEEKSEIRFWYFTADGLSCDQCSPTPLLGISQYRMQ